MTAEKVKRIFEPFGWSSDKDQLAGNGVGLSICKQICEQLGGTITCKS